MLISRQVLFGNPDRMAARISPDGERLAFIAPLDGVLNVWVGPVLSPDQAKPVTDDRDRGVRTYFWAYSSKHIVYVQDKGGDENWRIYVVDLDSGETRDMTPLEGVRAEIMGVSHKHPGTILIGLNDRDASLHDIYTLDLVTGDRTLVLENPGFANFVIDDDYQVRFAQEMTPEGGSEFLKKAGDDWEPFISLGMSEALSTGIIGFNKAGDHAYLYDSRDRDTAALVSLNLDTGEKEVIAENPRADVSDVMIHPVEKTVEAVAFTYARKEWDIQQEGLEEEFAFLRELAPGEIEITSRTLDDSAAIVVYLLDDGAVRYYHVDRKARKATFLFKHRDDLEDKPLVHMHPVVIEARDGLKLVSYLSLPQGSDSTGNGRPETPLPLVLLVHGGPWARDEWGFDPYHQWLANRGYAVLSVNFRGSVGFGKAFLNAGNLEWGAKMHDDLIDAVRWAEREGIADPAKVAIMGGSYGGYATLAGLTLTPDTFACGIDIVGPSNLITLIESIPPYWAPMRSLFTSRVGDLDTEEGREFLHSRSPLTYVARIEKPLLIGQGANDPRVKQAESDQIVTAMQDKKIPVTYVLYPDEGHGFARPENRLSFHAVAEAFLAEVLGGRFEAIGDDFEGSSIEVPAGAGFVPGLETALSAPASE